MVVVDIVGGSGGGGDVPGRELRKAEESEVVKLVGKRDLECLGGTTRRAKRKRKK